MPTLSDIQNRRVRLAGWKNSATIRVRRKIDGKELVINLTKYDDQLHDEIEEGAPAPVKTPEQLAAEQEAARKHLEAQQQYAAAESITRDEMATMSIAALKKLPQWKRLGANVRDKAKTKEEIINALAKR